MDLQVVKSRSKLEPNPVSTKTDYFTYVFTISERSDLFFSYLDSIENTTERGKRWTDLCSLKFCDFVVVTFSGERIQ